MPKKRNRDSLPRDEVLGLYQRLTIDRKRHFQAEIARDTNCSPQTVARRVDLIERHLGKDAYIERGVENRRRYYRVCSVTAEKALGFSFEELEYLSLCRDIAASSLPEHVANRIDQSLIALALHLGESTTTLSRARPLASVPRGT